MAAIYATALLILAASLVAGHAVLRLLGRDRPTPLAGAVGFATLTISAAIAIRLPGRATTAAIVLLFLLLLAMVDHLRRSRRGWRPADIRSRIARTVRSRDAERPPDATRAALATILIVLATASLPFLFNDEIGPLGEGIYTNDQAAQLFWTDWLQNGFGPEPNAVSFGYPTGPQSLTATASEATGASLEDAFNGLLLAIGALTALTALAALESLPPVRRVAAASIAGLPYLAASYFAQSAFKETAMAMIVLASAILLSELTAPTARRATIGALALLAAAAILTYSLPGLVWLAIAIPIWAALSLASRGGDRGWRTSAAGLRGRCEAWMLSVRQNRSPARLAGLTVVLAIVIAIVALNAGQVAHFVDKVGEVQSSAGRLSSPVFPGEALGVWPEGDFRIVRGEVTGAIPAALFGLVAATLGGIAALRRRDNGVAAMLAAGAAVYVGARLVASIYVQAKALAVISPLVLLAALRALLAAAGDGSGLELRRAPHWLPSARFVLGAAFAAAAAVSTLLALRAAPVGFDDRGQELESLAARVPHASVAFVGVDRFGGYWLRNTLVESPGGYIPAETRARPEKVWQQGLAMDLDTLSPHKLSEFDYAITTSAAYQSTPPSGMREVARTDSYVLWKRVRPVGANTVLNAGAALEGRPEDGAPGATLDCSSPDGRSLVAAGGTATVLPAPVVGAAGSWTPGSAFDSPGTASQALKLAPGRWRLSLQYHSQSPLTVEAGGGSTTLEPSLVGMYLTDFVADHPQDSFWPAGTLTVRGDAPTRVTVTAAAPNGLQDALGVRRQVWLGEVAATRVAAAREVAVADACGRYVDRIVPSRAGH